MLQFGGVATRPSLERCKPMTSVIVGGICWKIAQLEERCSGRMEGVVRGLFGCAEGAFVVGRAHGCLRLSEAEREMAT